MSDFSSVPNILASTNTAAGADATSKHTKDTPEAVAKAASQFEALLIGQLLKSARESEGEGWLGTDENDAGSTLAEMSEQALSSALASKGGLGLAKLVTSGLQKTVDKSTRTE
jgi:Rod binding domain-containing protein